MNPITVFAAPMSPTTWEGLRGNLFVAGCVAVPGAAADDVAAGATTSAPRLICRRQLHQAHERALQAVAAAGFLDELAADRARHVILAADLDADPESASARFWTGRQALSGTSVCYRDAWESVRPGDPGHTFTPETPIMIGRDWPFRRIDYVFVRCGEHEGPPLEITSCERIFDRPLEGVWA